MPAVSVELVTYYHCETCHHTTQDHMDHGKGSCLIEGCTCGEMKPGEEYKRKKAPPLSYESALNAVVERRKQEK